MPLPPWSEVWDALRLLVAPTLATALLAMFLARWLLGEKRSSAASGLALAAAVFVGNYFREAMEWRLESDRPLSWEDFRTVVPQAVESKFAATPADEEGERQTPLPPPVPRYWLPWLAALAVLIELATSCHCLPLGLIWAARSLFALFAARLLVAPEVRLENPLAPWLFACSILLIWEALTTLARQWRDGTIAAAVSICFLAAGLVNLHAHSLRLMDIAMIFSAAFAAIAIVAWIRPSDTSAALAAAAVVLPGVLFISQNETFSEVPLRSFLIAGLAPLALLPLQIPRLFRLAGWKRWSIGIVCATIPAAVAVGIAAAYVTLTF